ncbi:MAG TPA: OmpA family protein [Thermoanaerobaculia bacterium]|nr:OmpA family protein [Thermoanaerobaculia bacterium]
MKVRFLIALVVVALAAGGCATKKYTREYVAGETQVINERVDDVEEQVEQAQGRLSEHDRRITQTAQEAQQASATARQALERAQEAGQLAQGKLLYEVVLTDQDVRFGVESSNLSPEARAALDRFAEQLKQENRGVFVEIQGHTDATGSEAYNERLGLERAEAVRNYLSRQHQFPLHRMNVISYGESSPTADNSSRQGRSQNRRVALVVLE